MNLLKVKQIGSAYVVSINLCHKKRAALLANKGVILRVTWKQSYLSAFIISFTFSFLFYFLFCYFGNER